MPIQEIVGLTEQDRCFGTTLSLIKASNDLAEVRKSSPGSEQHNRKMAALLEIIANNPGALERLKALQL